MGKHAGAHKMEKRRKEITRQKKQEEKRRKRLQKGPSAPDTAPDAEITVPAEAPSETKEGQPT